MIGKLFLSRWTPFYFGCEAGIFVDRFNMNLLRAAEVKSNQKLELAPPRSLGGKRRVDGIRDAMVELVGKAVNIAAFDKESASERAKREAADESIVEFPEAGVGVGRGSSGRGGRASGRRRLPSCRAA